MTESFHARVMALPQFWVLAKGWHVPAHAAAEIAAEADAAIARMHVAYCHSQQQFVEADALRETAEGLRVALSAVRKGLGKFYPMAPREMGPALTVIDAALAAYTKATGEQHAG